MRSVASATPASMVQLSQPRSGWSAIHRDSKPSCSAACAVSLAFAQSADGAIWIPNPMRPACAATQGCTVLLAATVRLSLGLPRRAHQAPPTETEPDGPRGVLLRVADHGDRGVRVRDCGRPSGLVDDVEDAATSIDLVEKDRQEVMQAACRKLAWHLERTLRVDIHVLVEEAIAAHAVTREARHAFRNLESRVAVNSRRLHPGGLGRYVIGHLVLKENVGAAVAVPDHLVLLEVLDEQAVSGDVVTVDDDAGVRRVGGPPHPVAVVRAPRPNVVEDRVVAVDDQAGRRLTCRCPADAEEHVGQRGWIRRVVVAP